MTGVRKAAETAGLNLPTTELACAFGLATAQAMQPIRDDVRQSEPAAEPAKAADHKKSPASCGAGGRERLGSTSESSQLGWRQVGRRVITALRVCGHRQLCCLQALSLHSFVLDQYEVVHANVPQRFKSRCMLEIELRH